MELHQVEDPHIMVEAVEVEDLHTMEVAVEVVDTEVAVETRQEAAVDSLDQTPYLEVPLGAVLQAARRPTSMIF